MIRVACSLALIALLLPAHRGVLLLDAMSINVNLLPNGILSYADHGASVPAGHKVEWSNNSADWYDEWDTQSFIASQNGSGQVPVPLLFRVVRVEGSEKLPPAVVDSDYYDHGNPDPAKVVLGQALFFDKILSGNQNISCATCHHPLAAMSDGLSLGVGEGGVGLATARQSPALGENGAVPARLSRNTPPLFNLGAQEFRSLNWDGRVSLDPMQPSGYLSPAGDALPSSLDNVLAAQAMFPVASPIMMAGQAGENPVADASAESNYPLVWELLALRLQERPEYVELFLAAFPGLGSGQDISFAEAANALAAFISVAGRSDQSPFDVFLRGDAGALTTAQKRGLQLFYGKAGCATCHSGSFQTDQNFWAIAMPQIGPGMGDGFSRNEDYGRGRVTRRDCTECHASTQEARAARAKARIDLSKDQLGPMNLDKSDPDRYKFRTPSLRNVALTGPWGHSGAYNSLEAVLRHHLDTAYSIRNYDTGQAILPPRADLEAKDFALMSQSYLVDAIVESNQLEAISLSEEEIEDLLAFLHALSDPAVASLRNLAPLSVPSGLPLAD